MPETVGQILAQARQDRGISLEEASRATRIRIHYLKALEGDDQASLPSPTQSRGFLRLYAEYLGLNQADVLPAVPSPKSSAKSKIIKASPRNLTNPAAASNKPQGQSVNKSKTTPSQTENSKTTPEPPSVTDEQVNNLPPEMPERLISNGTALNNQANQLPISKPARPKIVNLLNINKGKRPPLPNRSVSRTEDQAEEQPKSSHDIFIEIGQTLQKQREMLNLSLDEVCRYTHLRLHHLKTLENGRMDELASPVQARGMLSNYARFLNLDDEKLLLIYADALQTRRLEHIHIKPGQKAKTVSGPGLRRFISMDLIIGSLLIFGMFGFLIWGISQVVESQKQGSVKATLPSVAEILALSPTNTPGKITPQNQTLTLASGTNNNQALTPLDTPNPSAPSTGISTTTPQAPSTGTGGKSSLTGPIQVYVVARNSAWMKVVVDSQTAFMGRVIPGNAYTYAANKQLEVICGNAAALQVIYNTNDMGTLGVVDQVIDLIFTPKGLVAATPSMTPSPSKLVTGTPNLTRSVTPQATGSYSPTPPLATGQKLSVTPSLTPTIKK
jgi:cytoskeleton protein RodZ